MNIFYVDFTLKHKSLDFYLSGCNANPKCAECANPELWNFDIGVEYDSKFFSYIERRVKEFDLLIDNIMILGGEPLDQNEDKLLELLFDLKHLNKKIWLFTRYELNEISDNIKFYCDYIKTGKYIPELKTDNNIQYDIQIATSNQKIFKKGVQFI
jgi:anaerobic ribonucleoside-triphosphate reductase activating protein